MQTATGKSKNLFQWALQHYNTCKRAITKNCETFQSPKSYGRAIVTTFVANKKAFWQHPQHPGWKQAGRKPPPTTRNGAPMRVLYTSEREDVYRFVSIFVCYAQQYHKECFVCTRHPPRHWYNIFCTQGCVLVENGTKTRYTGEENKNLLRAKRAERFGRYVQECCNIHHGRDTTYLHQVFFPKYHVSTPKKRRRKTKENNKVSTYRLKYYSLMPVRVCMLQAVKTEKGNSETHDEDQWENAKKKVRAKIQTSAAGVVADAEDTTDEEEELIKEIMKLVSKKSGSAKEAVLIQLSRRLKVSVCVCIVDSINIHAIMY